MVNCLSIQRDNKLAYLSKKTGGQVSSLAKALSAGEGVLQHI